MKEASIPKLDWTYANHFDMKTWQEAPDTTYDNTYNIEKIEDDDYEYIQSYSNLKAIPGPTQSLAGIREVIYNVSKGILSSEATITDTNGKSWIRPTTVSSSGAVRLEPGETVAQDNPLIKLSPYLMDNYKNKHIFVNDTFETTGFTVKFKFKFDGSTEVPSKRLTTGWLKVAPSVLKVSYKNINTGDDLSSEEIMGVNRKYGDTITTNAKVIDGFEYVGKNKITSYDAVSDPKIPTHIESTDDTDNHIMDTPRSHIVYWYDVEKEPTEPTEPAEPTEPTKPTKPTKPAEPTEPKSSGILPQTGEQYFTWVSGLGTTLLSVAGYIFYKRR